MLQQESEHGMLSTNELEIYNITGTFRKGETITGSSSGASHLIRVIDLH